MRAGNYVIKVVADVSDGPPADGAVAIYFHANASDLRSPSVPMAMDATAPTRNAGPPPAAPYQSWSPGAGTGPHAQWATLPLRQLGVRVGVALKGYRAQIYINCSIPGVQPSGVANLNVDLFRVDATGTLVRIAQNSTSLQQLTLNQTARIRVPTVDVNDVTIGPFDRVVADLYLTGARAAFMNLVHDDVSFPSGVTLHMPTSTPASAVS